jgi:acyl-CoA thioester hydrolase
MVSRENPRPRAAYRWWHRVVLRWADNDAYGHVNNAVHYQWFDSAVNQWLVEKGLLDIERADPIGLVVETSCRYFASLAYPGTVDVGIAVERLGTSSVTYRIGIFGQDSGEPAAQGHFIHVYVGRETRRPVALPDDWRAKLELLT